MFRRLIKSKVFWTSVGGILVVIGTMVSGDQEIGKGLAEIFGLAIIIFFRDTLAKTK